MTFNDENRTKVFSETLTHFHLPSSEIKTQKLLCYFGLLEKWGRVFNLTADHNLDSQWVHWCDSFALAKVLAMLHVKHCTDIGSGGGFPAIPAAILNPKTAFTLCEIDHNKKSFLQQVVMTCSLSNVRITGDWRHANPPFSCLSSKAFLNPSTFITQIAQLITVGGVAIVNQNTASFSPKTMPVLLQSPIFYKALQPIHNNTKQGKFDGATIRSLMCYRR